MGVKPHLQARALQMPTPLSSLRDRVRVNDNSVIPAKAEIQSPTCIVSARYEHMTACTLDHLHP